MAFVQVLRIEQIYITLQLVLLPLSLQHAAACSTIEQKMVLTTTSGAETLAKALLRDVPEVFLVSWNGDVVLSRSISVSNRSTMDVTGSSESTNNGTVDGDGTVILIEVNLDSTVALTGLTLLAETAPKGLPRNPWAK